MTGSAEEYVPKLVKEWSDRLQKDTGISSTVERVNDRTWRLITESDRVRLTLDFANPGNGKIKRRGSTLAVDGVQRDLARDYPHLLEIFKDPDESGGATEKAEPMKMPPPRSAEDAPFVVKSSYQALYRAAKDLVQIGEEDGRWVIGFEKEDRAMRMVFSRRHKTWEMEQLQLILDGIDRSREVRGDLAKAIALMNGDSSVPSEKVIGSHSASARTNSVEVRRATVIRN